MDKTNKNITLVEVTRELLTNRPITKTYNVIAEDTGLTFGWIQSFQLAVNEDYSSNRVQTLYEYLSGKKLFN